MPVERRPLTVLQILALVAAIAIAGYLTWTKATGTIPPCTAGGGCAAALYSRWGYVAGIPLAYLGLAAATTLLALAPWRVQPVRVVSLMLLLVGALFTIYLRYVEQAHFGGNVCIWCVSFMGAWWVAGACEVLRLARPARDPA